MIESEAPGHLSHHRLLERIGPGGMGEVWLAEDAMLSGRVAIKLLPPQLAADGEAIRRLLRGAGLTPHALAGTFAPTTGTSHTA